MDDVNAFAFTLKIKNDVFITEGLNKLMTEEEKIAITLHEIQHTKQSYNFILHQLGSFADLTGLYFIAGLLITLFPQLFPLIIVLMFFKGPVKFISNYISRYYEYNADSYAVKYGYGHHMKTALIKLGKFYKQNIKECSTTTCVIFERLKGIFQTHPTIPIRLKHIKELQITTKEIINYPIKSMLKIIKFIIGPKVTTSQIVKGFKEGISKDPVIKKAFIKFNMLSKFKNIV